MSQDTAVACCCCCDGADAATTDLMLRAARVFPRGAATSLLEVLPAAPRGRDAAAPRGVTRAARSISSVAAASVPSQQEKQATAVSRDHDATGQQHWPAPRSIRHRTPPDIWTNCFCSELISLKSLGHYPDRGRSKQKQIDNFFCGFKTK